MKLTYLLFLATYIFPSLLLAQKYNFCYTLAEPNQTMLLPKVLEEISGIALSEEEQFLFAVQDEKGLIFKIDKQKGEVLSHFEFWKDGDYEDIEVVNGKIYVLKNTGTIYEVTYPDTPSQSVNKYNLYLTDDNDAEGLTYDSNNDRLLIACKKSMNDESQRQIYAFDIDSKKISEQPVFLINHEEIVSFLETHPALKKWNKLIEFFDPNEATLAFSPSAIAIHPTTKEMYLLSSVGKILMVLDADGKLLHIEKLSKKAHCQPEGICFEADGTLFISNEGKDGLQGCILRFEMK